MLKKLGKMVKRNVENIDGVAKSNASAANSLRKGDVKGAFSRAKDSAKMAVSGVKDQAKDVGGMAKSAAGRTAAGGLLARRGKSSGMATPSGSAPAKSGGMMGRGFARAMQSKDMPMGQLDRMRAQRGMIGSIPGQMRDYSEDEA